MVRVCIFWSETRSLVGRLSSNSFFSPHTNVDVVNPIPHMQMTSQLQFSPWSHRHLISMLVVRHFLKMRYEASTVKENESHFCPKSVGSLDERSASACSTNLGTICHLINWCYLLAMRWCIKREILWRDVSIDSTTLSYLVSTAQHYGGGEATERTRKFCFFLRERVLCPIVLYDPMDSHVCLRTLSMTKITYAIWLPTVPWFMDSGAQNNSSHNSWLERWQARACVQRAFIMDETRVVHVFQTKSLDTCTESDTRRKVDSRTSYVLNYVEQHVNLLRGYCLGRNEIRLSSANVILFVGSLNIYSTAPANFFR